MFSGNARDLSIYVRDGLLRLEQDQAGGPETLIEELEQEAAASLRSVQKLIDEFAICLRNHSCTPPVLYFAEWIDTWSAGNWFYLFDHQPDGVLNAGVAGQRFEVFWHCLRAHKQSLGTRPDVRSRPATCRAARIGTVVTGRVSELAEARGLMNKQPEGHP